MQTAISDTTLVGGGGARDGVGGLARGGGVGEGECSTIHRSAKRCK